jgi:predicted kinase
LIISPDSFLISNGLYYWTPSRAGKAWKDAKELFAYASEFYSDYPIYLTCGLPGSGKSTWAKVQTNKLIFDATLTKLSDRNKVRSWAGRPVHCVFFDTPLEICLERNSQRTPDRIIGADVIQRMVTQLVPPTKEEGFLSLEKYPR